VSFRFKIFRTLLDEDCKDSLPGAGSLLVAAESLAQAPAAADRDVQLSRSLLLLSQPLTGVNSRPGPTTTVRPSAPVPLAIVNGQSVTTADIDPKVREEVDALEGRVAEARRQILELQINTLLWEVDPTVSACFQQQCVDLEFQNLPAGLGNSPSSASTSSRTLGSMSAVVTLCPLTIARGTGALGRTVVVGAGAGVDAG